VSDKNQVATLLVRGQGGVMVATEIDVGMISARQTVTVMAQDGQFRPTIGGKEPHGCTPHHDQQDSPVQAYTTQIPPLCAPPADAIEGTVPVQNEHLFVSKSRRER
jgi:hypothetical protein